MYFFMIVLKAFVNVIALRESTIKSAKNQHNNPT